MIGLAVLITLSVVRTADKPQLYVDTKHADKYCTMLFSPKAEAVAVGSLDGALRIIDLKSGDCDSFVDLVDHSLNVPAQTLKADQSEDTLAALFWDGSIALFRQRPSTKLIGSWNAKAIDFDFVPAEAAGSLTGALAVTGKDNTTRIVSYSAFLGAVQTDNVPAIAVLKSLVPIVHTFWSKASQRLIAIDRQGALLSWSPGQASWKAVARLGDEVIDASHDPEGKSFSFTSTDNHVYVTNLTHVSRVDLGKCRPDRTLPVWFSPSGRYLAWCSPNGVVLDDLSGPSPITSSEAPLEGVTSLAFAPDESAIVATTFEGKVSVKKIGIQSQFHQVTRHLGWATSAFWTNDSKHIVSCSTDGTVRVTDVQGAGQTATWRSFGNRDWAVVTPDGRFDSSQKGSSANLRWIVRGQAIEIDQFSETYYTPNLLARSLGIDKSPVPDLPELEVELPPTVELDIQGDALNVSVKDSGGGIGPIEVYVQGTRIREVVPPPGVRDKFLFQISLNDPQVQGRMLPESDGAVGLNQISVQAFPENRMVRSKTVSRALPSQVKEAPRPKLFAVIVGCDYKNTPFELSYPTLDAEAFAKAITAAAQELPFAEVTVKTLVTGSSTPGAISPTKENILGTIGSLSSKITANDVFLLFVSGHGTPKAGGNSGYFYLTSQTPATPIDVEKDPLSSGYTLSAEELASALEKSVFADKKVIVLDTCAAGAAGMSLTKDNRVESAQELRRFQDRSGCFLLAGSAADASSYESPSLEHGLLTYALLEILKGENPGGLRKGTDGRDYLDIDRWFGYCEDRVVELSSEIGSGRGQRPRKTSRRDSRSFDLGVVDAKVIASFTLLEPLPLLSLGFVGDENDEDSLDLAHNLQALVSESKGSKDTIKIAPKGVAHPAFTNVNVRYKLQDGSVVATVTLQKFDESSGKAKTFKKQEFKAPPEEIASVIMDSVLPAVRLAWESRRRLLKATSG